MVLFSRLLWDSKVLKRTYPYFLIYLLVSCGPAAAQVNLFSDYDSYKRIVIPQDYQSTALEDIYELKKDSRQYHAFVVFYRNRKVKSRFMVIVNEAEQVEDIELIKSYDRRTKKVAKRSYLSEFFGLSTNNMKMPDAISGATQSSQAIKKTVKYILKLHKAMF